jgi:hypothetical protein
MEKEARGPAGPCGTTASGAGRAPKQRPPESWAIFGPEGPPLNVQVMWGKEVVTIAKGRQRPGGLWRGLATFTGRPRAATPLGFPPWSR